MNTIVNFTGRILLSAFLLGALLFPLVMNTPVTAADYNFYIKDGVSDGYWKCQEVGVYPWDQICHQDSCSWSETTTMSNAAGFINYNHDAYGWSLQRAWLGFDVGTEPEGYTAATVRLYITQSTNTKPWNSYYALYGMTVADGTIAPEDFDNAEDAGWHQVSDNVVPQLGWQTFTIDPDEFDYLAPDGNGIVWLCLATNNDESGVAPATPDSGTWNFFQIYFNSYEAATNHPVLTYSSAPGGTDPPPIDITIPVNDDKGTAAPTERADSISWVTPRAAFGGEHIGFAAYGEVGAPVELEFLDENGTVIDSIDDEIRVDNYFWWDVVAPSAGGHFVRCHDKLSGRFSKFGYVAPARSTSFGSNTSNVIDTIQPQYTYQFSRFLVGPGDALICYWRAGFDYENDLDIVSLRLEFMGDPDNSVYNTTLDTLKDDYFDYIVYNNDVMLTTRFAIFTLDGGGSGYNTYDDMIIDLGRPMTSYTKGFYVPVLFDDNTDQEITEPNGAYFYLASVTEGVAEQMTKTTYGTSELPTVRMTIGDDCGVLANLFNYRLDILDPNTSIYYTIGTLVDNYALINSTPITLTGQYKARVTLTHPSTSYKYIHDLSFSIGTGTGGGGSGTGTSPIDVVNAWLEPHGWNNSFGHWTITLVLMFLSFVVLNLMNAHKLLQLGIPLLIFGLAIISGWIDPWVLVLLALGAGVTLWGALRKRSTA